MYKGIANSFPAQLTTAISATDTTLTLDTTRGLPNAPDLATIGADDNCETILYTGKSATQLTGIKRGFEGTAQSWNKGTVVVRNLTAYDYNAMVNNIKELQPTTLTFTKQPSDWHQESDGKWSLETQANLFTNKVNAWITLFSYSSDFLIATQAQISWAQMETSQKVLRIIANNKPLGNLSFVVSLSLGSGLSFLGINTLGENTPETGLTITKLLNPAYAYVSTESTLPTTGTFSTWKDFCGTGINATQTTTTKQPKIIAGNPPEASFEVGKCMPINIPHTFFNAKEFAIAMRIKFSDVSNEWAPALRVLPNGVSKGMTFVVFSEKLQYYQQGAGGVSAPIQANTEYDIVLNSSSGGLHTMYVDTEPYTFTPTGKLNVDANNPFVIGNAGNEKNPPFQLKMLSFYPRLLSLNEVKKLKALMI